MIQILEFSTFRVISRKIIIINWGNTYDVVWYEYMNHKNHDDYMEYTDYLLASSHRSIKKLKINLPSHRLASISSQHSIIIGPYPSFRHPPPLSQSYLPNTSSIFDFSFCLPPIPSPSHITLIIGYHTQSHTVSPTVTN